MKLEYLAAGSPDCPLIRLYDFTPAQAGQLHAAVTALANGATERIELDRLPFVESVGSCRLAMVRGTRDQCVQCTAAQTFVCRLTAAAWENVAGLIEPFAKGAGGFQWLAATPGEVALALSVSGQW
jgi:hypothetical protein